jgi:hypothetical protein
MDSHTPKLGNKTRTSGLAPLMMEAEMGIGHFCRNPKTLHVLLGHVVGEARPPKYALDNLKKKQDHHRCDQLNSHRLCSCLLSHELRRCIIYLQLLYD